LVGGDGAGGTGALLLSITIVATRTWVHRTDKHKVGREGKGAISAADGHAFVFDRLAQHFEDALAKFGQLVQKKHAAMRQ